MCNNRLAASVLPRNSGENLRVGRGKYADLIVCVLPTVDVKQVGHVPAMSYDEYIRGSHSHHDAVTLCRRYGAPRRGRSWNSVCGTMLDSTDGC